MSAGELLRVGVPVAVGVVKDEILEEDEVALQGEAGAGVGEIGAGAPAVANGAGGKVLVEAGQRVFGDGQRQGNSGPRERLRQGITPCACCTGPLSRERQDLSIRAPVSPHERPSDY